MSRTWEPREPRQWRDRRPTRLRKDRTCKAKHYYSDEIGARAGAVLSIEERRNTGRLWVYRCPHCSGWHLTSNNQGPRYLVTMSQQTKVAA